MSKRHKNVGLCVSSSHSLCHFLFICTINIHVSMVVCIGVDKKIKAYLSYEGDSYAGVGSNESHENLGADVSQ